MKQAERITRTSIKEVSRRVYVRSSIIEYRAGQIETEREGFPRVYTCSHHGTPAPGQCRWDGATPRCRECRPPIRILGKKGKKERNVHCRDDKSGINRATSRLSININSETRIPRGQIRELDSHTDEKMGVAKIVEHPVKSSPANDLRRGSIVYEASDNLDDFSSRGDLLLSLNSSLRATPFASSFFQRATGPALRVFRVFSFFSPFLSFSKGILDSTGERDHRDNVRFGEVRVSIIAIPFKKLRIVFKYTA